MAQSAITALRGGTVPSGVAGVCVSRAAYAQGDVAVITSSCGSGAGRQQWRIGRQAVRDGEVLPRGRLAVQTADVHLRRCNGSSYQQWTALGNGLLRNTLAGLVPARPEQHGHPGDAGQRRLVHRHRLARLVVPSSPSTALLPRRVQRRGSASGRAAFERPG